MAKTRALVQFREQHYQALFEDARVFIQGVEVTPWITGSIAITRTNRDAPGTCTFTLDNGLDRFVITADNLSGKWRDTTDRYSESAKVAIYRYKTGQAEVTHDRVAELIDVLFNRNIDLVKAETSSVRQRLMTDDATGRKRRNKRSRQQRRRDEERGKISGDQELELATNDVVQDMPADVLLNEPEAAEEALFERLAAEGIPEEEARTVAATAVIERRNELVKAGRKRPAADGPAQETNQDNSAPERSGRQTPTQHPKSGRPGHGRCPLAIAGTEHHLPQKRPSTGVSAQSLY